jgi:flagellar biosynthetic protein FlhB
VEKENHHQYYWIDLQFFAAEDEGRTEEPSDLKIRKAREEGRVAKSQDLGPIVVLLAALLSLILFSSYIIDLFKDMFIYMFTKISLLNTDEGRLPHRQDMVKLLIYYFKICSPVFILTFLVALVTTLAQVGFLFTTKPLKPDFKKIVPNLGKYISKSFFGREAYYNLAKSLFKAGIIIFLTYYTLKIGLVKLINSSSLALDQSAAFILQQAIFLMIESAIALLILAGIDYIYQRRQYLDSLKMTKQEVKDEMKENEGNPHLKGKIRSRMMDFLRATMMQNVPKSDVVITNPTHFAVALEYKKGARAPKVSAKGQDLIALKIKEVARAAGVPVIENKPLARALHANIEIGQEVPQEYWELVSNIFVQVYKMTGKRIGL